MQKNTGTEIVVPIELQSMSRRKFLNGWKWQLAIGLLAFQYPEKNPRLPRGFRNAFERGEAALIGGW